MTNIENLKTLKQHSKKEGVPLWRVAERVGISEFTFSRHLRHLTKESAEKYMAIIDDIKRSEDK